MDIAALISWIVTAAGGSYLLATWIGKGGLRENSPASRFPPALIFGHFLLAVAGLIVWIVYLVAGTQTWAWVAFALLLLIAALGFAMLIRWIPGYRSQTAAAGSTGAVSDRPAEQHFPVVVVGAHGLLAVTTLVLVLLAALEVGS